MYIHVHVHIIEVFHYSHSCFINWLISGPERILRQKRERKELKIFRQPLMVKNLEAKIT